MFYHYKSMVALDPQGEATYQTYKLCASWFQRRRFLKFFFSNVSLSKLLVIGTGPVLTPGA